MSGAVDAPLRSALGRSSVYALLAAICFLFVIPIAIRSRVKKEQYQPFVSS